MTDEIRGAIEVIARKVAEMEETLTRRKQMVNELCEEAGLPPRYADAQLKPAASGVQTIRSDQYYGKTPTIAAREYIEMRGEAVEPDEIVDALERGGFDFDTQGWKKQNRVRNLAIAMSKNSLIFHRLPNGTYGLVKFYPEVEAEKKKKKANADDGAVEETAESTPEEVTGEGATEEVTE